MHERPSIFTNATERTAKNPEDVFNQVQAMSAVLLEEGLTIAPLCKDSNRDVFLSSFQELLDRDWQNDLVFPLTEDYSSGIRVRVEKPEDLDGTFPISIHFFNSLVDVSKNDEKRRALAHKFKAAGFVVGPTGDQ